MLISCAVIYAIWLQLFAIYRYLLALEMLAPLILALILLMLPQRPRLGAVLAMVAVLLITTRPAEWLRVPFTRRAVEVTLPSIDDPDHSLVLLAGHEPLSFLIPAFPAAMRFLRIDSTFTNPEQTDLPFNAMMKQQIDHHQGPLLALFIPRERHDVITRLGNDGLRLAGEPCQSVRAAIGAGDYALCPVERK